jgi:predicted Zn-dependent peptidase
MKSATSSKWDYARHRRRLPGGLLEVLVVQPHLHHGTISVHVGAGSRYESADDNGLSHFLEHMIFRGTARFPTSFDLNLAAERLGGSLNAATTPDSTEYTLSMPSATLERGVELIAELVTRPRFRDLEIERRVIAEEIREDLDEHGAPVDIDFLSRGRLWPGDPLGQSVTGPLENAMRFKLADVRRRFESGYLSSNMVVCVSGAFDPSGMSAAVERAFGGIRRGSPQPKPAPPVLSGEASTLHAHKPGSQTQVRVAFHAPGMLHADSAATQVLLRLMDDGMSTPLHRRIFETLGLAYNVGADLETYLDVGALNMDAACSHDNVPDVVEEMLAIAARYRDEPVPDEDLEKARQRAVWSLEAFQDSADAMTGWYGEQELFREAPAIESEADAQRAVEGPDVSRAAGSVFMGSGLHVTTVGVLNDRLLGRLESLVRGFGAS